jgi:ribonuclease HII
LPVDLDAATLAQWGMGNGDSRVPHYRYERMALKNGAASVAGIDEAGRGPLAGPVVAAAVILDGKRLPKGVNDSKQLLPERREELYAVIMERAEVGVGIVAVEEIDRINILNATFAAMVKAVNALVRLPAVALIDGNVAPGLACATQCIIAGDAKSMSIAAASIIAKVTRDRLMVALDAEFPQYGFASHKGYSTPEHFAALQRFGPSIHHRRSFAPVRELCETVAAA